MIRYIIKRLVYAVLTLFVLISLTFFMMRMLPGDRSSAIRPSATAMASMNAKYGLDKACVCTISPDVWATACAAIWGFPSPITAT